MTDAPEIIAQSGPMKDTDQGASARSAAAGTELLVCMTCRSTSAPPDLVADAPRPGARLMEALRTASLPEGVRLRGVECLSNCDHGCTVALRGGDRWTYVYGNLDPGAHLEALIDGVARYHATSDGLVPWRDRPVHFRKNCVARIPPATPPQEPPNV